MQPTCFEQRLRICIVTSAHSPFDIRIFQKQARTLVGAGYEVILLAPHLHNESVEGVHIIALPKPQSRLRRWLSLIRIFKLASTQPVHVYHLHDPDLLPVGLFLKWQRKGKVVYDAHEDYRTDILSKEWIPRWCRRPIALLFDMVEKLITRRFDGVIAATDFIASRFTRHRVIAVRNYPPLALLQGARSGSNTEKQPLLIYIGGLAATRGIKEIVDAMSLLAVHPEARLKLIGPWIDKNVEKIVKASKGFEKVDYQGSMPWKDVWSHLLSARIGLVCFHPTPSHLVAGPNKLFEYMAAGLPIIASDFPEWRQIVEIAGCGLTVDPLNPAQLAQAVEYLLSHPQESEAMGKRGQQYVLERANWEREKDRLLDFFRQL